ncbi:uncharacterized protein LOC126817711 [Patella vulgata]|uniref:uncharacterized protein LOC126817711 n=1 Tax=Patella vulgata TaxID=6465 RepID=UPI0024A9C80E|nr:uncharacterized protein LOC126817711 [Patella vulgata]
MEIDITQSDDGRTEMVMLTIHNTTIDDFYYIYNMKIQFTPNCVRYAEPVSLIEVPRVFSKMPEMIGRPTADIKFVWHYYYSSPATGVVFDRYTSGQLQKVGYWNGTRFYSYIGDDRLQFSNTFLSFGQAITLTITNTTADDFNTIYGCKITFIDGVAGYDETKLLCDRGPRLETVANHLHGKLGDDIILHWTYTYCPEATDIRFFRINSSGQSFLIGRWAKNQGYQPIGNNRAVFYQSTVEGKEEITLVILNTDAKDYNSTYICEVIFEDISRNLTAIELILIRDTDIESGALLELNLVMMTALPIVAVFICALVGLGLVIYGYTRKTKRVVNASSNPANNMRHSYISLNSVVIFHANRDSTTTNAESTASNDTDAYANPYDPINRDNIDTSKNLYMSLQNPGTSNINQGDDVQETNVDDTSVTNIDDVQTADDDVDDVGDDDDTSTLGSNPYNALNKYTANSDVLSYISLPPCTRSDNGEHALSPNSSRGEDVMFVKKRPSTI